MDAMQSFQRDSGFLQGVLNGVVQLTQLFGLCESAEGSRARCVHFHRGRRSGVSSARQVRTNSEVESSSALVRSS